MPNNAAFGNVWPQWQRGWQAMYGNDPRFAQPNYATGAQQAVQPQAVAYPGTIQLNQNQGPVNPASMMFPASGAAATPISQNPAMGAPRGAREGTDDPLNPPITSDPDIVVERRRPAWETSDVPTNVDPMSGAVIGGLPGGHPAATATPSPQATAVANEQARNFRDAQGASGFMWPTAPATNVNPAATVRSTPQAVAAANQQADFYRANTNPQAAGGFMWPTAPATGPMSTAPAGTRTIANAPVGAQPTWARDLAAYRGADVTPSPQDIANSEQARRVAAAHAARGTVAPAPVVRRATPAPGYNVITQHPAYAGWTQQMNDWMSRYGNTAQGQQLLAQYHSQYGNSPFVQAYFGGQAPRATLVSAPAAAPGPGAVGFNPTLSYLQGLPQQQLQTFMSTGQLPSGPPRAQPAVAGTEGWSAPDWMGYRVAATQADPFAAGAGLDVTTGDQGAYVGQPLTGDQSSQPVSSESELRPSDTAALGASGGGEPGSRYNLTFNPNLTNIGGMQAAGGSVEGGFSPAGGTSSFFKNPYGTGGGGGGGAGTVGAYTNAYSPTAGDYADWMNSGFAGGGSASTGGGGMSGGTAASLGQGIASVLGDFANVVAKANAPVSVNPAGWAGPVPAPAQFAWPTLSPNQGGVLVPGA